MTYFLWLVAICTAILATNISHRVCRTKLTDLVFDEDREEDEAWRLVVGNNLFTLCSASLVLLIILLFLHFSSQSVQVDRVALLNRELAIEKDMGRKLGQHLVLRLKARGQVVIVDRVLSPPARLVHDARMAGFKEGIEAGSGTSAYRLDVKPPEFIGQREQGEDEQRLADQVMVTASSFDDIIRRHPQCDILV